MSDAGWWKFGRIIPGIGRSVRDTARADQLRERGTRPDPDSPDDFLCAYEFPDGELCERAASHTGDCTPNGSASSVAPICHGGSGG